MPLRKYWPTWPWPMPSRWRPGLCEAERSSAWRREQGPVGAELAGARGTDGSPVRAGCS